MACDNQRFCAVPGRRGLLTSLETRQPQVHWNKYAPIKQPAEASPRSRQYVLSLTVDAFELLVTKWPGQNQWQKTCAGHTYLLALPPSLRRNQNGSRIKRVDRHLKAPELRHLAVRKNVDTRTREAWAISHMTGIKLWPMTPK